MQQSIYNIKIVTDGDMSSNIESDAVTLMITNGYAIQAYWTGTPEGELKLQVSNDGDNYTDIAESIVSVDGSAGSTVWLEPYSMYDRVKVIYTASSGSGTLNVQINGKGDKI